MPPINAPCFPPCQFCAINSDYALSYVNRMGEWSVAKWPTTKACISSVQVRQAIQTSVSRSVQRSGKWMDFDSPRRTATRTSAVRDAYLKKNGFGRQSVSKTVSRGNTRDRLRLANFWLGRLAKVKHLSPSRAPSPAKFEIHTHTTFHCTF